MSASIAASAPPTEQSSAVAIPSWKRYVNRLLANELSRITRYYDCVIQWLPRRNDTGLVLANIDAPQKQVIEEGAAFPDLTAEDDRRSAILVNGTFNHHFDIQGALASIKTNLARTSRVLVVLYNPYLRWLYVLANRLGIRTGDLPSTFITRADLENIAKISGFEVVQQRYVGYLPWRLFGLGTLINRIAPLIPVVRWFGLTLVATLRPVIASGSIGLSCVIPARNEKGNIENALKRLPDLKLSDRNYFR